MRVGWRQSGDTTVEWIEAVEQVVPKFRLHEKGHLSWKMLQRGQKAEVEAHCLEQKAEGGGSRERATCVQLVVEAGHQRY